ncbi:MAG TPA: sigma-70 family RNA polymerase sigma factor [Phycisphaerae bacterium]|nr:sigma-70 family RNA polymerase sigma factor [Phycisphaerae bacterium]
MNTPPDDWQLLDRFAAQADDQAFATLVQRHVDLVHGTARRTLGATPPQLDDAVQAVFVLLARKAAKVPRRGALAGWLFRVTRYCCANVLKSERRRKAREREVGTMRREITSDLPPAGADLQPLLDDGLARLGERERQVILLHYLQKLSAADTARQLGISRAAAEKRVERGLAKLRNFFRRRGHIVPAAAVAAILSAEAAKAAPAGIVAHIVAAKAAAGATAAGTIAQGALQMMRWIQLKLVLAITGATVACAAIFTTAAMLPVTPQTTPASPASPPGLAPRRPMMVRWDYVMSQAAMKKITTDLAPARTLSSGYDACTGTAAQVRAALSKIDPNEIFIPPQRLGWASMNDGDPLTSDFGLESHWPSGVVRIDPARNIQVVVNMNGTGPIRAKTVNGAVHLDFEGAMHDITALMNDGTPSPNKQARMNYVGDVPVDHAVVFAGMLAEKSGVQIWHVAILESFAATRQEFDYLRRTDPARWVAEGPARPLADAVTAINWARAGKPLADVPPKFEKHLASGATVCLAAISRAQWPDCWWDAAGKPVAWDPQWDWGASHGNSGEIRVAVSADDPSVPEPKSPPGQVVIRSGFSGPRKVLSTAPFTEARSLEVGVAAGPWKEAGPVAVGQEIAFSGATIKLVSLTPGTRKNGNLKGLTWVKYSLAAPTDMQVVILGRDKQGHEILPNSADGAIPPEILFDRAPASRAGELTGTLEADVDDLASFTVRWRPREWITFDDFALAPQSQPGRQTVPPPAAGASTAPAGTPEAFQEEFRAAAASGDPKKVRALMTAKAGFASRYADAQAEYIATQSALRNAAEKQFGKDAVTQAMGQLLPSPDDTLIKGWKVEGDRATAIYKETNAVIIGSGSELVRVQGQWKMEVALPEPFTEEMKTQFETALPQQAAQIAALRKLAEEITSGKYKDAFEARDALLKLRNAGQ